MVEIIGVFIPVIALLIPIIAIWTKHQRHMAELQIGETAENAARQQAHTQELEERIRVLERIITDKSTSLAAEIEDLRKQNVN